jgi:hypothetical protein
MPSNAETEYAQGYTHPVSRVSHDVKLHGLKGGASRYGTFPLYCAPDPALRDGACGAHAGHGTA